MKQLGRSIGFWAYFLGKTMLIFLLAMAGVVVFATLMEDGGSPEELVREVLKSLQGMLAVSAFMMVFVNSLSQTNTYVPMAVSMGCTRKNCFVAMQVVMHVLEALLLLLIILTYGLSDHTLIPKSVAAVITLFAILLIIMSIGNVTATVGFRFGRIGGLIVYTLMVVLCSASVSLGVVFFSSAADVMTFISKPYLLVVGVIADVVTMWIQYRVMMKAQLQF